MKRIIALMLVIVFVVTLSACGNKDTVSDTDTSTPTISETFVKPENYTSVLLISINPQFKLYLDENNIVLAVDPVNEDAKSFSKSIDFENKTIEVVVGNIVEKANEKGFIKKNTTVDFEITEQKDGIDNSNILTTVVLAVNQKAAELKIEIITEIKESDKFQTPESSEATTSSQPEETTKKEESTSNPTTTIKPTESKPTHTHEFSAATCTSPQKCSCGETKGSASGHKWQDANCKTPKTCSVCKVIDGAIGTHVIENGLCKFCSQPIVVSPKNFDKTKTYVHITKVADFETDRYVFTDVISVDSIGFSEWLHIGNQGLFSSNTYEFTNFDEKISYNGKDYYTIGIGGVGIGITYVITEKEIIIRDEYNPNEYAVLNLLSDGSIKVISKTNNFKGDWETQIGWIYKPAQTFF